MARAIGTTISLKNIFHTLAVRHKEFMRNVKREYGKARHRQKLLKALLHRLAIYPSNEGWQM